MSLEWYGKPERYETWNGSKVVITTGDKGAYTSRLYVNNGETATLVTAKHKSRKGFMKWAERILAAPPYPLPTDFPR